MAVRKINKGSSLKRWFNEKWTDEKGRPCGERDAVKKCRPSKKINSDTPVTWGEMSVSKKKKVVSEKKRVGMGNRTKNIKREK